VAAPARVIVAQPTTVTGSIGVVAARMSIDPLLAKLGIAREAVERGKRASLLATVGALTDDERAAIARELDATYQSFLGVVAEGRKLDPTEVEKLARGRVYTGKDAHAAKLVDVLGGFDVAVAEVKRFLPPPARDRIEVTLMTTPPKPVSELDPPAALAALLPPALRVWLELHGERVLALGPVFET
jgi:protease-4